MFTIVRGVEIVKCEESFQEDWNFFEVRIVCYIVLNKSAALKSQMSLINTTLAH